MKKLFTVLLSVLLVLGLTACGGSSADSGESTETNDPLADALLTSGKIIVATSPDYPPFESLSASGELEGFEIEMIGQLVDVLNEQLGTSYEIEFKQMSFDTIISAVQAKQADIGLSAFSYTEERAQMVGFCNTHISTNQMIITRNDTGIASPEDFEAGMKVGAPESTTAYMIVSEYFPELEVVTPGDYTVIFQNLVAGNLDLVVADYAVGINYVNENDNLVMCEEPLLSETLSMIVNIDNTTLKDALNTALDTYLASEQYQALKDAWGM